MQFFLPTAFWITATYSLLFSAANSKNQKCLNWIGEASREQLISISVGSIQTNLLSMEKCQCAISKTVEIRTEDVEPVAPPAEVVETTTVTQTPQGAGV